MEKYEVLDLCEMFPQAGAACSEWSNTGEEDAVALLIGLSPVS